MSLWSPSAQADTSAARLSTFTPSKVKGKGVFVCRSICLTHVTTLNYAWGTYAGWTEHFPSYSWGRKIRYYLHGMYWDVLWGVWMINALTRLLSIHFPSTMDHILTLVWKGVFGWGQTRRELHVIFQRFVLVVLISSSSDTYLCYSSCSTSTSRKIKLAASW